ncbi:YozE family protein [Ureibacillus sp. FSL W8-0352]|uniref:YozE family protein n=1 Tax=Ureibacillus sp. FSL W8-0352 TaxID=2954596 RepID=UPI0030FAB31A
MSQSFYQFVLSYRGGDLSDPKTRFAEKMFQDHSFPKISRSFEELSSYIETLADDDLSTNTFDELWEIYRIKNDSE